jgi:ABC-type sugar transport system substrate-binding protein
MPTRAAIVSLILAATVTGCSGDAARPVGPARHSDPPSLHRLSIEFIATGRGDAYYCSLLVGAQQAARADGVDLIVHNTAGVTSDEQVRLLGAAIEHRASAVVLDPQDYPSVAPTLRAAHDQEEHVVLLDVAPDSNPGFAWTFVSSDPRATGRLAAKELVHQLGTRRGKTLAVTSSTEAAPRVTAFRGALHAFPGFPEPNLLTLDGGSAHADETQLGVFLRAHSDIVGAFAADGTAAVALVRANAALARPLPLVSGDAESGEVALVSTGKLRALVAGPGSQTGQAALSAAIAAAFSRPVPNQLIPPVALTEEDLTGPPSKVFSGFDTPGCTA